MPIEAQASAQNAQTHSNDSSDLNFTSSGSSSHALPSQAPRPPSKSTFQWPSEPLNQGRPSLPQESQKSVDDANRDISDRITHADHGAATQHSRSDSQSGLDHPRLSVQLANALDNLEDDRRHDLSPTNTSFFPTQVSSLPMLSPLPQSMQRTSSNGTSKSAGSDKSDAADAADAATNATTSQQYSAFLPDMFRNAATMPVNLLRSLIPDNAFPASHDEGLSASTLQVPVTSFNALFEACKALEWVATQASNVENQDKASASASRRNSTAQQQQQSDDGLFDYLQLLQKVADVVSGLAASRGIDLVLDLEPKLQGQPAENQRNYKLGSCTVWADRIALTFLFMSCISRLLHNAPLQSSVVLTSTLTEKEENLVRPDSNSEIKLMVLSLGLRLILPRTVATTPELMSAISGTPASLLLDAFGARLTTEQTTSKLPGSPDRAVIDHFISVPVGQLPQPEEATALQQQQQQQQTAESNHVVGPNEDELVKFASLLRGKKVALYSTSQSLFARQVARFLSDLGCDIAPVFSDSLDESSFEGDDFVFGKQAHTAVALTSGRPALVSYTSDIDRRAHTAQSPTQEKPMQAGQATDSVQQPHPIDTAVLDPVTGVPVTFDNNSFQTGAPGTPSTPLRSDGTRAEPSPETQIDATGRRVVPFSFVIIDDDIVTLQKELLRIRSAVPLLKSALVSKSSAKEQKPARPTLDHRTKSSPQVNRLMASQPDAHSRSFRSLGTVMMGSDKAPEAVEPSDAGEKVEAMDESVSQTIIFFTSMKSYRLVRDTVQPIIDSASFRGVSSPPEIMVLPKPAGAKRILTALHLAEHKPVVRLPFLPIATSPLSPLTTHAKTWWTPEASQKQDGERIMTLTRRQTASTDTDFDATPGTPWTPIDAAKTPVDGTSTSQIPLTKETLPLAAEPPAQGASVRTNHTQETARDGVLAGPTAPGSATTTKSAPRSNASRQTGRAATASSPNNLNANVGAGGGEDPWTQKSNNAGSGSNSTTSPLSSIPQSRSHAVSSPMPADALEYFSETAAKMGGSAASGMVIQSPDGRPAGIFFQPKATPSSANGSKPTLSRGVSASSLRRSHGSSDHGGEGAGSEGGGGGNRERRLTGRSNASSSGGASSRGNGLATLSEQRSGGEGGEEHASASASASASGGGGGGRAQQQLQVPNTGKYPSGSMFAPQVGIHSVLNSSRPPMTTPLGPSQQSSSATGQEGESKATTAAGGGSVDDGSGADRDGKQSHEQQQQQQPAQQSQSNGGGSATGDSAEPAAERVAGAAKAASESGKSHTSSSAARKQSSSRTNPATTAAGTGEPGTKSTPNARTSTTSALRSSPHLPSTSSKPSAVPQSGFMMGMGFTSSARRGRGPKKAPVREAVLPPIKVLIVEDNPINQRILSMFMGKKKIKYDVANNGREAVEKWKTGGYHLILMDIQLPVMDGIEATKEIRRLERCANIGILPNSPAALPEPKKSGEEGGDGGKERGSRTVSSKSLVGKAANAGEGSSKQELAKKKKGSGGPPSSALVNGVGVANVIPTQPSHSNRSTGEGARGGINPFRASVIIVALTASVLSSDRVEALAAGCNDFLNKPVSLPWLNQKILEWGSMMYLMYSGLSSDDLPPTHAAGGGGGGGGGGEGGGDKAQLHLGFGYGPAEKAKALANNLHLGDTLAKKKKKVEMEERKKDMVKKRDENVAKREKREEERQEVGEGKKQGEEKQGGESK